MRAIVAACIISAALDVNPALSAPLAGDELLREIGRATVFVNDCPAVKANYGTTRLLLEQAGFDPEKAVKNGDPAFKVISESIETTILELASISQSTRCLLADALYGPEGSKLAGLVQQGNAIKSTSDEAKKPTEEPKIIEKKTVSAPAAAPIEQARRVAGVDLEVAPRKFLGKLVEIAKMRCLYADVGEFRCIPSDGSSFAVFAPKIIPPKEQDRVEAQCGTIADLTKARCLVTIRFRPEKHDQDILTGYQKRTVVVTEEIEVVGKK